MKYVIIDNDNVIIHISDTIGYQSNGNPLVDNGTLAIAKYLVKEVYEVEEIPQGVTEAKYCYTETDGFYKNTNYVAPLPSVEEQIADIQLAQAELYEMLLGGIE